MEDCLSARIRSQLEAASTELFLEREGASQVITGVSPAYGEQSPAAGAAGAATSPIAEAPPVEGTAGGLTGPGPERPEFALGKALPLS